uniref:Uncharacterized protein n=1 Tax=Arundo donax TaxID=35708 RepID=A0A0A8XR25_ARUDO
MGFREVLPGEDAGVASHASGEARGDASPGVHGAG